MKKNMGRMEVDLGLRRKGGILMKKNMGRMEVGLGLRRRWGDINGTQK